MPAQLQIESIAPVAMVRKIMRFRKILVASTRVEVIKRYSGSLFGQLWLVLQPAFLLSVYLFVYLVIFKMRFPGYSQMDYVLYVFCGLIPYIGFSEAISTGCYSIKQNLNLVNNVLIPIELLPVRSVMISMVGQLVSLGLLILMVGATSTLGVNLLWLPFLVALQMIFLVGIVWVLSALAVLLPDISYFVNYILILLMFVSPIGFKPDMVPGTLQMIVYINPIHYMIELYRNAITENSLPSVFTLLVFCSLAGGSFLFGAYVFSRFKDSLVDA